MAFLDELADKIDGEQELTPADLKSILELEDEAELHRLYALAYAVKRRWVGCRVFLRGIIEVSNICSKDCYYCGIRRSNPHTQRFRMSAEEIMAEARWAFEHDYGSLVLQSGEVSSSEYVAFIEQVLRGIKEMSYGRLGITLSLGEQSEETYRRWFAAGGHRYLLRIEASDPQLYAQLHPADHRYAERLECLKRLRRVGYQTGTGVMIGLPGQTIDHLVGDLLFFRTMDIDMIGMGPYIVHDETPLAARMTVFDPDRQLKLGLKMIAAARLLLKDVNIAATTALQALHPRGRELGLQAGANVIMPNVTDTQYRPSYQLYRNKPAINENSEQSRLALEQSVAAIGETIAYGEWGDPRHFFNRGGGSRA
ncbi:MAG: [FeFe] hydrogenase H-cluster radical SAM maturase HydE [Victivallales bacterium]|nr:[FeFe] hydrogenase H-cluster radical SAM maturase HydE [Victivallales bacterium]